MCGILILFVCSEGWRGVSCAGDIQLSSLQAGSYRWQWLGLCLPFPADHRLLV